MKSLRTVALKTEWFFTFDLFCFLLAGLYSYWAMPWISSTYVCSGSFFCFVLLLVHYLMLLLWHSAWINAICPMWQIL
jgi:hypothetical protein